MTGISKYLELKACLSMAQAMPMDPRTRQMLDDARAAITELEDQLAVISEREPIAHIFPDDLDKLRNSGCAVYAYSVEMGDPDRGETVPVYLELENDDV